MMFSLSQWNGFVEERGIARHWPRSNPVAFTKLTQTGITKCSGVPQSESDGSNVPGTRWDE